ncbi:MAG: ABC transporter permease subunit [Verrucomicrobiaceae bacterium]|nr:MAG: ABC transporter permease subunit [Verrucomicrobiaceae bacterium]
MKRDFFGLKRELPPRRRVGLVLASFLLPLALWCAVSYIPWLWHPQVLVEDSGEVEVLSPGDTLPRQDFERENTAAVAQGLQPATGHRVNPVYLPAPDKVFKAFHTAFTTEPRLPGQPWLHESLWHSIKVVFWGFFLSSLIGVPLGILCGAFRFFSRLIEPFTEFFRYLPAPAFGALCIAVLGIYDAPKVAIIFIGTFFQQVLVIANTVRKTDPALIEAAQTLGANNRQLVTKIIIPASLPDIYKDMRILLGWAWTYLIVSEVVGTTSGITWFINQQARYRQFDNVFAAIIMIGIIGLVTDLLLAWTGRWIFPWQRQPGSKSGGGMIRRLLNRKSPAAPAAAPAPMLPSEPSPLPQHD